MKKPTTKIILQLIMMQSYTGIKTHQKFIDEWNEPKDVVQRAAVIIRDIHKMYGDYAWIIYEDLVKK